MKDDFNDNMCRKYINYPVLDVYLLQRDVQSPHIALSVNDPRKWMNDCRANVDNLYCYQTFLKCDEETGVGIELCKSSCSPMHLACRKSENETIPNLKKLTTTTHEIQTEIVNGRCPTCTAETVLVSIWPHLFRCMTCGTDLEQKVNGKISYIPNTKNIELRMKVDGQS